MKITTTRRLSQIFFFCLFLWFCIVTVQGVQWWQLRGWPVNWFLYLDPLVALNVILSTHTFYYPLLWSLVIIGITIVLGRVFCGFICPFGTLHHFTSYLAHRHKTLAQKVRLNRYSPYQSLKYFILLFFLFMAALPVGEFAVNHAGFLDPIPLITRTVNLVLMPSVKALVTGAGDMTRYYQAGASVFTVFIVFLLLNTVIPRFYCRFVCPLGALLGVLSRFSLWHIGHRQKGCTSCGQCESECGGACAPSTEIHLSECILCCNCLHVCPPDVIGYQTYPSVVGELTTPNITRRHFVGAMATGILATPVLRLDNALGANWNPRLIRPPGAIAESEFLKRCIKCGQCVRICPTNVIQFAGLETGLEQFWTPIMNNRIGASGCQLNCTACGAICPTAAIRPISLEEKLGLNEFSDRGPVKIGTAFVDRSRCLPFALKRPCIVCEENCPVSPKAIYVQNRFETIRHGICQVKEATPTKIILKKPLEFDTRLDTGDYYCFRSSSKDSEPRRIVQYSLDMLQISTEKPYQYLPEPDETIEIQIKLQQPSVDLAHCIGCGVCEHECPVSGLKAIRVTADGETRHRRSMLSPMP